MWAIYAMVLWMFVGLVRCFAAVFYHWGKKEAIITTWRKEVASDLIAVLILGVLIIAWFMRW